VTASFQRGGSGFDSGFGFRDTYGYSNFFRLSVNFPLLDQLQREESVVRANVAEDNAAATSRDARLRARQELTQMYGLLRNAGQRVAVQLVSVAASEEDLRLQQQRYALGAATVLEVLTSQAALDVASDALINARFDQRVARARLEALIGRPLTGER
jgi:outer membrane protein